MTILQRWTAFNMFGGCGIAVQLGVHALLIRVFEWPYLAATAAAVEAAVLHNFVWHQRWTWKDRPAPTWRSSLTRLARFHVLNGAISLGGNLVVTALLVALVQLDPIAANAIAIVTCSTINFAASERVVFRVTAPAAMLLLIGMPATATAEPSPKTLTAWQRFEATLDARYAAGASAGDRFFVQDREGMDRGWRDAVTRGSVTMTKIDGPSIDDGKIHQWVGAVFIPGTTLDRVWLPG